MRLDHAWIQRHIPHAGKMCLLDEVLEWDAQRIRCRSSSHRSPDNPLRAHGRLGAACGVEYAAQAMAVHGVLVAGAGTSGAGTSGAGPAPPAGAAATRAGATSPVVPANTTQPTVGYLASVRAVTLYVERLDDVRSDLIATATRITSDITTVLYEFNVSDYAQRPLLHGRATIVFDIRGVPATHSTIS